MKNLLKRIRAVVNKPRVMHYADIFLAAFGTALYWNRDRLLGAHGLNIVGSLVFAGAVAGGKAVIEAYRKNVNLPTVAPAAEAPPQKP